LRDVPLFAGLTDQVLASLAQACRIRQVPKGKTLFNQMDPAEAFYVVRSGRIAILLGSADGRELVINEMRAGDCFGELALLTGQPRSTSAIAREASEVIAISRETFLAKIETEPKLLRHVLESTARRLSASSERESALAFLDAPARLARVLLQMDRQASADGFITVSQEELAQRVGLTRQTAAKTLGQWRRAGWIITGRGKIVLLNRVGLRRQAEESGS
ncbi:MAG TPA: Crp/Fnr family transcriptional regulator, partial [Anaerolineae bacterium]|nr:Crp/Fnr family transcriptional regulator [Anaerolineae bacterium]